MITNLLYENSETFKKGFATNIRMLYTINCMSTAWSNG